MVRVLQAWQVPCLAIAHTTAIASTAIGGVTERFMAVRRAAWASCVRASRESTGISAIAWLGLGLGLGVRARVRS